MQIHRTLRQNYYADCCSCAALVALALYYLALAVPFYVTFSGRSMWGSHSLTPLRADLQLTGEFLLILRKSDGSSVFYTNAVLQTLDGQTVQTADLRLDSESEHLIEGELTLPSAESDVLTADLFIPLSISNRTSVPSFDLSTLALLSADVQAAGSVTLAGNLALSPDTVLDSTRTTEAVGQVMQRLDGTAIEQSSELYQLTRSIEYKVDVIISRYPVASEQGLTTIKLSLASEPWQKVIVKPSYAESLKRNWVEYLSFLVPSGLLAGLLLSSIFKSGIAQTSRRVE